MKAGLLTFHAALNYGANLQALALQTYIDREICECEIINFIPNNLSNSRPRGVRCMLSCCKRCLVGAVRTVFPDKASKIKQFQNKRYNCSKKTYYGDADVCANVPHYDILISGSDQILNVLLSGGSETFYLKPWGDNVKKISYASSLGRENISEEEHKLIREELSKFSAISAREYSGAKIISDELGRDIPVVVDPVFLLSREEWIDMSKPVESRDGYVLAYAMEYSAAMCAAIHRAASEGKRVLLICGGDSAKKLPGEIIDDAGPDEFLTYIINADLVITNSFHGTAFSIIFGKPFVSVAHSTRNARIESIFKLIDSVDKMVTNETDCDLIEHSVDGNKAYELMIPFIDKSKEYLKRNC